MSVEDPMSDPEADQAFPRRNGIRRCSSAICLTEGKPLVTPIENPDLNRVKLLDGIKPSSKNTNQTANSSFMNHVKLRGVSDSFDDMFESSSLKSEDFYCEENGQPRSKRELVGSIILILSGLYGILLIVIGSVVPIAETFVHPFRPYPFEAFYIYLYFISIAFIVYIYLFLLHDSPFAVRLGSIKKTLNGPMINRRRRWPSTGKKDNEQFLADNCSQISGIRRQKITFGSEKAHGSAGSFYLRLGAVAFGIGCMILEGLYLGQILETSHAPRPCGDFFMILRPLLKPCFTFSQLFFIFRNSKIVIYKNRHIAKFGFMHMAATNICNWFRVIVMETLQTLHETSNEHHKEANQPHGTEALVNLSHGHGHEQESKEHDNMDEGLYFTELSCRYSNMIGGMLMNFSHFLYPFCIEYSVICAGILYVMWKNVGIKNKIMFEEMDGKYNKQSHRMSVDCSGSSRGLFVGIFLFVCMVCSMIVFYVISEHHAGLKSTAIIVHTTEIVILMLAIGANIAAAIKMRNLRFTMETNDLLEETLILISMTGLYMFSIFNLIAAFFYVDTLKGVLTMVVHLLLIILATTQTIFLIFGLRLSAKMTNHVRDKPGREFVTFLMLCNFSLWAITTFEMQKPAHNPQQMEMYGVLAWTIFTHISVPLGIFYFFHSTVCLSHIWKHAWKFKRINKP